MMIKKIILIISLAVVSFATYAGEHGDMQVDCHSAQIHYAHDKVWLNQKLKQSTAQLYILHNISKTSYWLNHDRGNQPMSAGWSSQTHPDHWSAIQINEPKFNITCTEISSAGTKELNCANVLRVCLVTNVQYPNDHVSGNYWVTEDKEKPDFYKAIVARHFSFKN